MTYLHVMEIHKFYSRIITVCKLHALVRQITWQVLCIHYNEFKKMFMYVYPPNLCILCTTSFCIIPVNNIYVMQRYKKWFLHWFYSYFEVDCDLFLVLYQSVIGRKVTKYAYMKKKKKLLIMYLFRCIWKDECKFILCDCSSCQFVWSFASQI